MDGEQLRRVMEAHQRALIAMLDLREELVGVPVLADCDPRRQGFNRQAGRANGSPNQGQSRSQNTSPTTVTPTTPSGPVAFPANPGSNVEDSANNGGEPQVPEPIKYFFKEVNVKLGVKGNFVPLAAKPAYLDLGDWLAHQSE